VNGTPDGRPRSPRDPGRPPPANAELATIFRGIADLLDLAGERFKPEAYRRAARSIESLGEDIRKFADRGELDQIPGIGQAIGEKTREFLLTGKIEYYDRLNEQFPAGIVEIMQLPGLGPKTARRFLVELGVEGPAELKAAIAAGKLNGLKGFGAKKIELIRTALEAAEGPVRGRTPILEAWRTAEAILAAIREKAPVAQAEAAGSLRRRREDVGDLDLLVTSDDPPKVFDAFLALPGIEKVKMRGPTKSTVLWTGRFQIDLRVVDPSAYGAALQYFTGSKDHNVRLRTLARDRGLKVNEYGVFRGEERLAGATEADVYAAFGLKWIPAEIREDQGELDRAAAGHLPDLIDLADLDADWHLHAPQGEADRRPWLDAAHQRGWATLGFVAGPGGAGDASGARHALAPGTTVRQGKEITVEEVAELATKPPGVDFFLVRADSGPPPKKVPRLKLPTIIAHWPGREPGSPESQATIRGWVTFGHETGAVLDVTPKPAGGGLDSASIRRAVEAGGRFTLSSAAETPAELGQIAVAVGLARRGWVLRSHVMNRRAPSSGARSGSA
jgi:DNA polymerase (family 10)